MVIEDDVAVSDLLAFLLRDAGFRVVPLQTFPSVHEILVTHPDLVIMEFILHDTEAVWRLLQALAADVKTRHIPVIICTAWKLAEQDKAKLSTLVIDIVQKPFEIDELLRTAAAAMA